MRVPDICVEEELWLDQYMKLWDGKYYAKPENGFVRIYKRTRDGLYQIHGIREDGEDFKLHGD